jgi:Mycothiol maleylpyruvate isomerase N-terminal domain
VTVGRTYAESRRRITDLVAGLGQEAERPVPTCPAWSVRDVIAHLAGVCADILAGNLAGIGTDAWADAQVRPRGAGALMI